MVIDKQVEPSVLSCLTKKGVYSSYIFRFTQHRIMRARFHQNLIRLKSQSMLLSLLLSPPAGPNARCAVCESLCKARQ